METIETTATEIEEKPSTEEVKPENTEEKATEEKNEEISIAKLNELLSLKKAKDVLDNRSKFIKRKTATICPEDDEIIDILTARLADLTLEQINALSKEQVDEILTIDGENVTIPVEDRSVEERYRRDFLVYLKQSSDILAEINKASDNIDKAVDEFNDEYKRLCEEFGDINEYMIKKMKSSLEDDKISDKEKNEIRAMLQYVEYGLDLSPIKKKIEDIVTKNGVNSTMYGYSTQLPDMIAKVHDFLATKAATQMEIPFHLLQDIEPKFLPDKYKPFRNLGLYLICRWVWAARESLNKLDYIFLSQVFYNIQGFYQNKLNKDQETFKQNFMSMLDIVIDRIPQAKAEKYTPEVK